MKGFNDLKEILKDHSLHIYVGEIMQLFLAEDRSYLKVKVKVYPEERPIIATMSWENVGTNSGDFEFPAIGDLVLIANSEGDDDQAYIIRRLTSKVDTIPEQAANGHKVHQARNGNKYWNISDTRINLSRGQTEPDENLVLGQIFKKFASDLLDIMKEHAQNDADHKHIGNLGFFSFIPDKKQDYLSRKEEYNTLKESPINDEKILSDLGFTEK
jgi:hypothetical protein